MKQFHLWFGLAIVVIFLLTGQYMEYVHNRELPDGPRMLYRSRHIYLLLTGLINLGLGTYFNIQPHGWRRIMQTIGSILIVLAPFLLLAGFFYEPSRGTARTTIAPLGIFAVAIGTLLHFISGVRRKRDGANKE
jgi:magnesium-transporting ATPase (P-type)